MKYLLSDADLHRLAGPHHSDPRRHLRHHRQAVRNKDICKPELALQLLQQQQNLRAHGNVQRRNRPVRDNELCPENQRPQTN